jgi:hypothetical protein
MHLETSDTERIEPDGVVVRDGTNPFIDTLALATGFDVWGRELAGDRGDRTEEASAYLQLPRPMAVAPDFSGTA